MAMNDHLLRFRMKSTEWLLQKEAELEAQETIFASQAMGDTSMQRDLRLLQDKLNAIAYVLKERQSPKSNQFVGVVDFSNIDRRI
jgi:hypothetical protein